MRLLARLVLWMLIALGALRGFGPLPDGSKEDPATTTTAGLPNGSPDSGSVDRPRSLDQAAMATASAFLRDYLTINDDRDAWAERLKPYLVTALDPGTSVSVPAETSQYVDYVQPVSERSVAAGLEVTVLAHLLESHAGTYRDGGLLAFVVPLLRGSRGLAVSGLPRPAPLPISSGRLTVRRALLSPAAARQVAAVARYAVTAMLNRDRSDLAALGGGTPPEARPLPDGWQAGAITTIHAVGPPEEPTAQVLVRAKPPTTQATYLIPIVVSLRSGADGLVVRRVDAGGLP